MSRRRLSRSSLLAKRVWTLLVLILVLAGCGEDKAGQPGEPTTGPASEAARTVIAAVDVTDPATVDALENVRFTEQGVQAAREALDEGAQGDELWAATWVYASSGTDPAPLSPLLEADDASVRVMAAAALLSLGDPGGFDVLASAVASDEPLKGSLPPDSVGGFADFTLARYTGAAPAGGGAQRGGLTRAKAWESWLDQHRDSLSFDASAGAWRTEE